MPESLASGVPAISSDTVGSQMLLDGCGVKLVFKSGSAESLAQTLEPLFDVSIYNSVIDWVLNNDFDISIDNHTAKIKSMYETLRK